MDAASDIFLSYKAEDRPRLTPLVEALEAEGYAVWWDQQIGGGTNWRQEIEEHLDAARCVIVAWSKRTVGPEGRFVRDEAGQAQDNGSYLPITIEDVRPPLGFRETQAIALQGWKGRRDDPRFQALLGAVRARLEGRVAEPVAAAPKAGISRRSALIAGGVAGAAVLGGGAYWLLGPSAANARRIAVLPFANLSGGTQDYFADGLAEELRGALSRAGLQVIGRTSSEAVAREKTSAIVEELDVGHILTGSVRKSEQMIRVSTQLVEGRDGVETWSQTYDSAPGDTLKIQADIAEKVASALSVALGVIRQAVEVGGTSDPVAQDLFIRARELGEMEGSSKDSYERRIDLLARALERDPNYARAWLLLGLLRINFGGQFAASPQDADRRLAEGERDVRRGLRLASGFAMAYAVQARVEDIRLRLRPALSNYRKALALAPSDTRVLAAAAWIMNWIAPLDEAEAVVRRLLDLDPLQATAHLQLSNLMVASGRMGEALAPLRRAAQLAPDNADIIGSIGYLAIDRDDPGTALAQAARLKATNYQQAFLRAAAATIRRRIDEADRQVGVIREQAGDFGSYQYAQLYALRGDPGRTFHWLGRAVEIKDPGLLGLMRDPYFRPMRSDRRFLAIIKRLDFPVIDPGIGPG